MGLEIKMNTSFQPQTDGQTERVNLVIQHFFKKLCGSGSTRLGGPFGIGQVLLQQFRAFGNKDHPLSNGDG